MDCGVSLSKGCHLQTPLLSSPEPVLTLVPQCVLHLPGVCVQRGPVRL